MLTPEAPAIHCSSITKNYGLGDTQVQALRGIDLDVHPGELMMLVGPSGCGKTTLISIIAGILDQTSSDCHLFGQNLRDLSQEERTRYRGQNIGFVFQAFNLIPTLTVTENVAIPLLIQGRDSDKALAQAYAEYQRRLAAAGAMDFDDLIMVTVNLLQAFPEVAAASEGCEWEGCLHHEGEDGCAVAAAPGVSAERLSSYRKLLAELEELEAEREA